MVMVIQQNDKEVILNDSEMVEIHFCPNEDSSKNQGLLCSVDLMHRAIYEYFEKHRDHENEFFYEWNNK